MISICMIMKNEEKVLQECLERLSKLPYELVLVDTGSTDSTKEIASHYTDNVFDYEWTGDFSAARNFSIMKASQPYILVVDCDEWLEEADVEVLEARLKRFPHSVGRIVRTNSYTRDGEVRKMRETVGRLFAKEEYHYEGRIHEQIVPYKCNSGDEAIPSYEVPLRFTHCGYEGDLETRRKKTERNIELLKKDLEEQEHPYTLFQLGKSYYMQEDYARAEECFDKALWYDLNPDMLYV